MSQLLEQAIQKVRELPEHEQDIAAAELLGYLADFPTPEERVAIERGVSAYRNGDVTPLEQWRHDMGLGSD